MKKMIAFILVLSMALTLWGCSAAGGDHYHFSPDIGDSLNGAENDGADNPGVLSDRKLIRRITMSAETEDMDALLDWLNTHVAQLDGYVESREIQNGSAYSNYYYRYATLVIRIPAGQLDSFVQQVGETSNIVSTKETSDDVTLQYVDTQSRLKVLHTEEERLLEFLAEAASVSEMLEVENRLTQVQSEIESLTAQLKTYDNLVDYGTITLNITEVEVYTPTAEPSLWQEIQETFTDALDGVGNIGRGLLVFFLGNSPYFLVFAVISGGLALIICWADRRAKKKQKKNQEAQ